MLRPGVEKQAAIRPSSAFDHSFNFVGRCCAGQHHEPIMQVLMDVSAHVGVHLVAAW
jgi:hypothetical protein